MLLASCRYSLLRRECRWESGPILQTLSRLLTTPACGLQQPSTQPCSSSSSSSSSSCLSTSTSSTTTSSAQRRGTPLVPNPPWHQQQCRQWSRRDFATIASERELGSSAELVEELKRRQLIRSPEVEQVMRHVDRGAFLYLPPGNETLPYRDSSIPIGHGQDLTAPSLHALCLELLLPTTMAADARRALDVGCGTGYLTGCLGLLMGSNTQVIGLERLERLVEMSGWSLKTALPQLVDPTRIGNVEVQLGNILQENVLAGIGTFHVIHVGAAATQDMLPALTGLLAPGGRMVVPVGPPLGQQWLTVVDKAADGTLGVTMKQEVEVRYKPLTRPAAQMQW